ncbi:hypothetical protein H4R33_000893 [Dimargaris cristalligena]|uniref:Cys/Met metabolism PLP-dependent enzyme-domain-containing protein n=1 Tax=Dimargaris cristalligena TaxID=215637 RepID=A0A4Q0A246_9FUNG|nr:hypothetical protein H4R33_000893 [Dimargaris cristalligena]RKP40127.1 Cys/Met metabolism PLP-dependent enzyme-domain-containing protein [Dimargaris cristalligena]|eukprot:RKP40127.1 Cys/Met metabolism PLP-dependent enzyme-domain-containing protein [Dimargaris cristalligena]
MIKDTKNVILSQSSLSTLSIHADEHLSVTADVAPAISVSSTFKLPAQLGVNNYGSETHVYARESTPVRSRLETVLGAVHESGHAVTYASGLAASFALLLHLKPRRLVLAVGYHGTKAVVDLYRKKVAPIETVELMDCLREGDLVWLENPINPNGEIVDVRHYADRARAVGATIVVDATLAPPPLQQPFRQGANYIVHSSAKYLSGHSDVMGGIIVTRCCDAAKQLRIHRTVQGSFMGSLESWLLLRSLRTLDLRVRQQSRIATQLVAWLNCATRGRGYEGIPEGVIGRVRHASLQVLPKGYDLCDAFPNGFGAVFEVEFCVEAHAKVVPTLFQLTQNTTSFGGVHSSAEWRHAIDVCASPRTLRVSVGLESVEDLKRDWVRALNIAKFGEGYTQICIDATKCKL